MDEVRRIFDQHSGFNPKQARMLLEKPMNPSWIESRKQGGTNLSYVGGHVVIRLLNMAFNQRWSFEVLDMKILGEPGVKGTIVVVHGRMTVPGLGVREQFGNQPFTGGAMDEHTIKGATTDAMKKCANMFGVALELFGEVDGLVGNDIDNIIPMSAVQTETVSSNKIGNTPVFKEETPAPAESVQVTEPVVAEEPASHQTEAPLQREEEPEKPASVSSSWDAQDLANLKANRAKIAELAGAETEEEKQDNNYLNPFIQEFLENPDVDVHSISPSNVRDFNNFLAKKLEGYNSDFE